MLYQLRTSKKITRSHFIRENINKTTYKFEYMLDVYLLGKLRTTVLQNNNNNNKNI